ncbi:MAG TPA: hypothetical protein GXX18_09480 [Bacillales bacterium]|nr:hypothetical protein [Bacillales bacterium]
MHDCPNWFRNGLNQRFNELCYTVEQQDRFIPLKEKESVLFKNLKSQLNKLDYETFTEWELAYHDQNSLEKEWIYSKGVKDGIRLMYYLNSCKE